MPGNRLLIGSILFKTNFDAQANCLHNAIRPFHEKYKVTKKELTLRQLIVESSPLYKWLKRVCFIKICIFVKLKCLFRNLNIGCPPKFESRL